MYVYSMCVVEYYYMCKIIAVRQGKSPVLPGGALQLESLRLCACGPAEKKPWIGVSSSPQASRWAIIPSKVHYTISIATVMTDSEPMRLRVTSKRKERKNCRRYNVVAYESYFSPKLNALCLTLTAKEDGHCQFHNLKFIISKKQAVTLIRVPWSHDHVYFYRMKWRMCRIHYTLKINSLTFVSMILKFHPLFQVVHRTTW